MVTVFDAQVGDGAVVLALEYIEGVTLEELLSRVGKLDWQQVAPLGREIARGLAAAHGKGIVHRDLKPGNVLLSRSGEVKLADFGLAAAYSALPKVSEVVVGTPGYIAPEILRGEPADFRTDLFALGVLYYRAIVGRLPFDGEDIREIVRATLLGKVQRPHEPVPELPIWFEELILGLLRPNPEERLSSADLVVEVLDLQVQQLGFSWKLEPFLTQTGLSLSVAAGGKGMPTAKIPFP